MVSPCHAHSEKGSIGRGFVRLDANIGTLGCHLVEGDWHDRPRKAPSVFRALLPPGDLFAKGGSPYVSR